MSRELTKSYCAQTLHIPWVTIFFLTTVFFLAHHDIFFSSREIAWSSAEEIAEAAVKGSLIRQLSLTSLGLFGFFSLLRKGRSRLVINGYLSCFILSFLVWALLSLVWAYDTMLTLRKIVVLLMICLGAFTVAERFSFQDIIFFTFFSCGMFLLIGISAEIFLGEFHPFQSDYRFSGSLAPNHQGWNCAMLLIASIVLAVTRNKRRVFFLLVAFIAFVFLILTKGRIAFSSTVIAFIAFLNFGLSRSRKASFILALSLIIATLFLLFSELFISSFHYVVLLGRTDPTQTTTLTGRIPLWIECFQYVMERPILGYGFNSFWTPQHVIDISDRVHWGGMGVPGAHNGYLDMVLGLGIVGGVTYVLILFLGIKRSIFFYRNSGNYGFAFCITTLVFYSLVMLGEEIASQVSIQNFILYIILAKLAFFKSEINVFRVINKSYESDSRLQPI